ELGAARDRLMAKIGNQQDLTDKYRQELLVLEESRGEYYEQAVVRMQAFLGGLEESRLQHKSRATPEPQDDQIVAELDWLGEELERIKTQKRDLATEQQMWKRRAAEL